MSEACVILAAGRGQRMGQRNKALLPFGERTFLATIAGLCRDSAVEEIVVVVAEPHERETRQEAEALGLPCVRNERPELGMGSSVAVGFEYAQRNFSSEYAWLWPVDVPAVAQATMSLLSSRCRLDSVVIPRCGSRGGHPVLVARSIWPELASCATAPEGARSVFRRDPNRLVHVQVSDGRVHLDVDHPEDLQRLSGEPQP